MKLLYGKSVAESILNHLRGDISSRSKKPGLAVILVGNDEASHIYVNLKKRKAHEIGMDFYLAAFEAEISEQEILKEIEKLNADSAVSAIIVQLPLPVGISQQRIISAIEPRKDADGFHPTNTELFLQGIGKISPVFPHAIMNLIESSGKNLSGKRGVVIANSDDFGKIMCAMLESQNIASGYVLAENIPSNLDFIKGADIVVSAVGSPGLLTGQMFKEGAIVVDGGIEKIGDRIFGDVDFASTKALDGYLAPVPGGVGPVTIACLLQNTFLAFEAQQKEE